MGKKGESFVWRDVQYSAPNLWSQPRSPAARIQQLESLVDAERAKCEYAVLPAFSQDKMVSSPTRLLA
jgi:hypothetical protein